MFRTWKKTTDEGVEEGEFDVDWDWIRKHRDQFLEETDWRAVKDRVLPTSWKEYRQALRDLPQNHADANSACDAWPTPPE